MEEAERSALYAYVGILLGFKIFTLVIILWLTSSWDTVVFILAGHILWVAGIGMLVAGPAAFWMRLFRVRRKRHVLQHAEWHVDEPLGSIRAENASDS